MAGRGAIVVCNQPTGKPTRLSASQWKKKKNWALLVFALVCVPRVLRVFVAGAPNPWLVILAARLQRRHCRNFAARSGCSAALLCRVFHFDFAGWPENCDSLQITASIVVEYSANLVLIERVRPHSPSPPQIKSSRFLVLWSGYYRYLNTGRQPLARALSTKRRPTGDYDVSVHPLAALMPSARTFLI